MPPKRSSKGKNESDWDGQTTTVAVLRSDGKILASLRKNGEPYHRVIHRLLLEHVLHARVAKAIYEGIAEPEKVVFQKEVTAQEAEALEEFLEQRRGPRSP